MAKIIALPNGAEAEFPDDMGDDAIAAVLQKQFPPTAAAPTQRTVGEEAKRQGGLTLRGAVNAITSPLTLGGNLIGKAVNAVAGKEVFKPSTEVLDAYLTKAGVPEAQTGVEKFTQEAARTMFPAARLEQSLAAASGKPILSSAAASGAVSGANASPENTGREALTGALGGGLGAGLGVGLGKFGGSLLPASTEARSLMKRGITPTLGQGVDRNKAMGQFIGGVEDIASTSPFHYKQVAAQREGVNKQVRNAVLNDATQEGLTLTPGLPVREQIAALRAQAGSNFDELNKGLGIRERPDVTQGMLDLISKHKLGSKDEREFANFVANQYNSRFAHGQTIPMGVLDDIRQLAWEQSGKASGPLSRAYADLAEGVGNMRTRILETSGRPLAETNRNYSKARVLEDAAKVRNPNRLAEEGLFSAADFNKVATKQGVGDVPGTLEHDTRILTQSPANPPRVNRPLTAGNVVEAVGATASGGVIPAIVYGGGKVLNNEGLRRYLLGDPQAVEQVISALRAGGANLGRIATVPTSSEE